MERDTVVPETWTEEGFGRRGKVVNSVPEAQADHIFGEKQGHRETLGSLVSIRFVPDLMRGYTLLLVLTVFHGELMERRCHICRCVGLPLEVHRTLMTTGIHLGWGFLGSQPRAGPGLGYLIPRV